MLNLNNLNSPDKDIETGQELNSFAANGGPSQPSNGASNNSQQNQTKEEPISWLKRPCLVVAVGIKWLPVAFITSVIGWSYYAFVVVVCFNAIQNVAQQVLFLIFYHLILVLFVWSYIKTIFAPKCDAPQAWKLSRAMVERLNTAGSEQEWKSLLELFVVEMNLSVMQRSVQGAIRYCDKCEGIKPDRSHHCSVCGACVLKMDHHCPWVNNCVAFNNYKFFMLFLGYALIYCVFLALAVLQFFVQFWTDGLESTGVGQKPERFHILFLFFVSVMFCISVSSLFWYHVYLVLHNRSTLEQFRAPYFNSGPDESGWSLGKKNNFQEVFGDRALLWFLPIHTSIGDGLTFPTRITASNIEANYQSTNSRPPMTVASPAANAVRGRSRDIKYIDEDIRNNGVKHTEVIMDNDERIQVKVSKLPKSDLMEMN